MHQIREPAVAGTFYPADPKRLQADLAQLLSGGEKAARPAIAVIAPHAGYMYSGPVAGRVYASVDVPDKAIVLCPNHSGMGARMAITCSGAWRTPLGDVPIAEDLARAVAERSAALEEDDVAHLREHSLEVQLPFLFFRNPAIQFVPICLNRLEQQECFDLGNVLASAIRSFGRPVLLVASTDLTHYEPKQSAEIKDRRAIDAIVALDPGLLYERVSSGRITMCGIIPTTVVLSAATGLGAREAELVNYATSGDASGDYSSVVGYAGIRIS